MSSMSKVVEPEVLTETTSKADKKIGVLGGTFNPPHMGHLMIAEQVRDQLDLDNIHFMPTFIPAHKEEKAAIDSDHRVEMVGRAIDDNSNFSLNLTEVNRGGKSYTVDTMKVLKEANPETRYYFIIGGDMVEDLPNWKGIDELVNLVQFVAVRRPNYSQKSEYPVIWIDVPSYEISSSIIRNKVKTACSIHYLTPEKVIEYIEKEGLYKDD